MNASKLSGRGDGGSSEKKKKSVCIALEEVKEIEKSMGPEVDGSPMTKLKIGIKKKVEEQKTLMKIEESLAVPKTSHNVNVIQGIH